MCLTSLQALVNHVSQGTDELRDILTAGRTKHKWCLKYTIYSNEIALGIRKYITRRDMQPTANVTAV
jgi:hypothetical protein